ncbi:MAG: acetyl-CoA carboxylase biotin carboxyl carrier protein subunit [Planctomycetota bacterium]
MNQEGNPSVNPDDPAQAPVPDWNIVDWNPPHLVVEVAGEKRQLLLTGTARKPRIGYQGSCFSLARQQVVRHGLDHGEGDTLHAPMHATVIEILTKEGDQVESGEILLVIEAMKMELPLRSPRKGTIKAIHVSVGSTIPTGEALVELVEECD